MLMRCSVNRFVCVSLFGALVALTGVLAPPTAGRSCANFLAINGVMYGLGWFNNEATLGRPLTDGDLGRLYRRVKENTRSWARERTGYQNFLDPDSDYCGPKDSFSTDLPRRTPLYELLGYDPTYRLAARLPQGLILLYDAGFDPTARTGGELFDIEDRVVAVRLVTREGQTVADIENAETVDRLVELMTAAPMEDTALRSRQESSLNVVYRLDDGTVADDHWFSDTGELLSGIQVPQEFSDILRSALSAPGTPVVAAPEARQILVRRIPAPPAS